VTPKLNYPAQMVRILNASSVKSPK